VKLAFPHFGFRDRLSRFLGRRRGRWTVGILAALIIAYLAFWLLFLRGLPSAEALLSYEPPLPTNVRTIDGTPVYSFARERRVELSYDELPPRLVQAFLSAEDKDFFHHHGIDPSSFLYAIFDYARKSGTGERARGGSTITQQVAKNLLLGNEYSPTRKVKEAALAMRIERAMSKQQILELYLNQIFLGRNAYGVEAAARAYFGKPVKDLTLPEAAYLAVLPKAPSNYDPERHSARALERRAYVLREMAANGYITPAEEKAADATPLGTVERSDARREAEKAFEGYFIEEVRRELIAKYGADAEASQNSVYSGGLWVRTSLDPVAAEGDGASVARRPRAIRGCGRLARPIGPYRCRPGLAERLAALNIGAGYGNWRPAVILSRDTQRAEIGFVDGKTSSLFPWGAAAPTRRVGGRAFDFLKAGDVVIVAPAGSGWALRSIPEVSGGMVAENPHTGQVIAMQGGFDSQHPFNRATQAKRQPGSSFKPFVYMAALDSGMTPASIIVDGPFCVFQTAQLGTKCFRNFTGGYAGPQTMRWGVEQSRNLMTVRAAIAGRHG
jgi:penicillin-binding protein 1A